MIRVEDISVFFVVTPFDYVAFFRFKRGAVDSDRIIRTRQAGFVVKVGDNVAVVGGWGTVVVNLCGYEVGIVYEVVNELLFVAWVVIAYVNIIL